MTNLLPSKWAMFFVCQRHGYFYSDHLFDQTEEWIHQALKQVTVTMQ